MELYQKLLKRIEDGSPIYCNETFAKDLEAIANKHFEQCDINDVVGRIEKLPNITLEQAIAKAKLNLDKITDVDKFLDDIR